MKTSSEKLREYLTSMDADALPPGLAARIWLTRKRRIRRTVAISCAIAVCVIAAPLVLQLHQSDKTSMPGPTRAFAHLPEDVKADVQAIDKALQEAYLRNASDTDVASLWKAREQLLARQRATAPAPGLI